MAKTGAAVQHEVNVDDELWKVWVVQKGGTWRAYGDFRRRHIDLRGSSASEALAQWRRIAEYMANE